jgi:sec-independent protein translocase protein TatA
MNVGWGELLVVFGIVLLIVGARRLPEVGRSLGQAVREFQRAVRGRGSKREAKRHKDG